jgi:hypothetical protein
MKKISIAIVMSAATALPVLANDSGFYIGADVGRASTDVGGPGLTKSVDASMGLIGGYQLSKALAIEGQYDRMGKIGVGNDYRLNATSLAAIGIIPVGNTDFTLRGKFGFARTTLDAPNTSSENGIVVGVGGQYKLTQTVGLRFGLDRYDVGNSAFIPGGHTTELYAGVAYKF